MLSSWGVPPIPDLLSNLKQIIQAEDSARRSFAAMEDGVFIDPNGRRDAVKCFMNPHRQIALGCWLAQQSRTALSVEVGFGMGITASFFLSARRMAGHPFQHVVFDPFGLGGDFGVVTNEYLVDEFGPQFDRQLRLSTAGLSSILENYGRQSVDFIFIDGDHKFDSVLADFQIAAEILAIGGYMILDDAAYPGVETLIHFIKSNRKDFEVSWLEICNTAVLRKVEVDKREWAHFVPFDVADRRDWAAHPDGLPDHSGDRDALKS